MVRDHPAVASVATSDRQVTAIARFHRANGSLPGTATSKHRCLRPRPHPHATIAAPDFTTTPVRDTSAAYGGAVFDTVRRLNGLLPQHPAFIYRVKAAREIAADVPSLGTTTTSSSFDLMIRPAPVADLLSSLLPLADRRAPVQIDVKCTDRRRDLLPGRRIQGAEGPNREFMSAAPATRELSHTFPLAQSARQTIHCRGQRDPFGPGQPTSGQGPHTRQTPSQCPSVDSSRNPGRRPSHALASFARYAPATTGRGRCWRWRGW